MKIPISNLKEDSPLSTIFCEAASNVTILYQDTSISQVDWKRLSNDPEKKVPLGNVLRMIVPCTFCWPISFEF